MDQADHKDWPPSRVVAEKSIKVTWRKEPGSWKPSTFVISSLSCLQKKNYIPRGGWLENGAWGSPQSWKKRWGLPSVFGGFFFWKGWPLVMALQLSKTSISIDWNCVLIRFNWITADLPWCIWLRGPTLHLSRSGHVVHKYILRIAITHTATPHGRNCIVFLAWKYEEEKR